MQMDHVFRMVDEARLLKNELGETKKAIKVCDKILKIEPNNRDAMLIKAGALKELGETDEFIRLSDTIIKKWPEHWEAYYLRSLYLFACNEDDNALVLMQHSIKLGENFDNVISYGQMLYLTGDHSYSEYVDKAKKINSQRAKNFLKNHWIWDENAVEPSLMERLKALKFVRNLRKIQK